jgi:uncharacterized OsmC-like protein
MCGRFLPAKADELSARFLEALGACLMTSISRIGQKMRLGLKSVNIEMNGIKEYMNTQHHL